MNFLSLFSGIGGIDLGLERSGMTCVGQVEIDPFCRRVLAKHWPDVPRFEDVRTFTGDQVGAVDLICGGFPCQDVSLAGKGAGVEAGERSGLWREFRRIILEKLPRWVLVENVPGLRTRGADLVLAQLGEAGYACWPLVVGAEHVGAPHRRHRVFIIGCRSGDVGAMADALRWDCDGGVQIEEREAEGGDELDDGAGQQRPAGGLHTGRGREGAGDADRAGEELANASGGRRGTGERNLLPGESNAQGDGDDANEELGDGSVWPARPGHPQHGWERPRLINFGLANADSAPIRDESGRGAGSDGAGASADRDDGSADGGRHAQRGLGVAVDGLSPRLVRLARRHNRNTLKAAGNSVVPQVVELIGRAIVIVNSPLPQDNANAPEVR